MSPSAGAFSVTPATTGGPAWLSTLYCEALVNASRPSAMSAATAASRSSSTAPPFSVRAPSNTLRPSASKSPASTTRRKRSRHGGTNRNKGSRLVSRPMASASRGEPVTATGRSKSTLTSIRSPSR